MHNRSRLWIGAVLLLLSGCEDLERTNPLDPGNPRSERRRLIFVEAFVNEATAYTPLALSALDSLATVIPQGQLIIVEHHLPSSNFVDGYALQESFDRYQDLGAGAPAVPDVFFNGSPTRAQGASAVRTALLRYRNAVDAQLGNAAHFTIEAMKEISAAAIEIEVTIARLGSDPFLQFTVQAMIVEDLGAAGRHHVVRRIFPPQNFDGIQAGEKKKVHFNGSLPGASVAERLAVVVIVEQPAGAGREVLQAALAE